MLSVVAKRHAVNVTTPTPSLPAHDNPTVVRLFEAAADAFADKGFHATTTRDIASRAGLSPAGVYVHFASKEDLLFQLSRVGHEGARDALAAAAAEAGSPTDALQEVISAFARWHAEQHQVARIVQYEFRHLSPDHQREVLTLRREIDGVVEAIISDGVATGEFAVSDVRATALAALSLVVDVARWYHPGIKRTTPASIAQTYGALALRLVGARGD
ncbi:TetR family transcriptional regulator [Janibacter hoylei PVAS-1]|uniref:TetR family transcriptional regulator n=1 Tax=Janibacter hoylei PVAS-1 TaxID=1210046 RepID=A0A444BB73_9MICO|nr:TetR family transcriptional regulator [Janibacter hoylei PVAS-1]